MEYQTPFDVHADELKHIKVEDMLYLHTLSFPRRKVEGNSLQ